MTSTRLTGISKIFGRMTGPTRGILLALGIAAVLPCAAQAAPKSVGDFADDWVRRQIGRGPKIIDSVLNAPNDLIVGRQVSQEMGKILERINARLGAETGTVMKPVKTRGPCGSAAVKKAAAIASDAATSRILRGFGAIGLDALGGAKNVPAGILKYAGGEVAKKAEAWALREITKQDPEDYTIARTIGPCTLQMRVVWIKARSQYRFIIAGDCSCNEVLCNYGSRQKIKLSRWHVTGSGSITPKAFAGAGGKTMIHFSVGRVSNFNVVANCCGQTYTSGPGDSWTQVPGKPAVLVPSPTPEPGKPAEPAEPKTPAHGIPAPNYLPVKIPEVPAGPVCGKDAESLIESAGNASSAANHNQIEARKYQARLETALAEGKPGVTQTMVDAAAAEYRERVKTAREAAGALRSAFDLKTRPCGKDDSHSMAPVPDTDEEEGHAGLDPDRDVPAESEDALQQIGLSLAYPRHCRAGRRCPMTVRVTNESDGVLDKTLVLSGEIEGVRWASLDSARDAARCAGSGRGMVCAISTGGLAPGETASVDVPASLRAGRGPRSANVCWSLASASTASPQLIQFALAEAGFDPGPVDGQMGPATRRAIEAARQAAGLSPETAVGPEFLSALMPGLPAVAQGLRVCGKLTVRRPPAAVARPETPYREDDDDDSRAIMMQMLMTGIAAGLDHGSGHRGRDRHDRRRREDHR